MRKTLLSAKKARCTAQMKKETGLPEREARREAVRRAESACIEDKRRKWPLPLQGGGLQGGKKDSSCKNTGQDVQPRKRKGTRR